MTGIETYTNGETNWRESANCATTDPNIMFPPKGSPSKAAKKICDMCGVTAECLAYQLTLPKVDQIGFAGGLTPKARKALLKAAS